MMGEPVALKRPLLFLLVGSVVASAALGIVIVLLGRWGWFEARVILTTVVLAGASLCGLGCEMRRGQGARILPQGGVVATLAATCLLLLGMWGDLRSESYWKMTLVACVIAIAITHVSLLSIARLDARFRWVFAVAVATIVAFAALLSATALLELDGPGLFRLIAAISIAVAALTLIVPLLHRISKIDENFGSLPSTQLKVAAIESQIAALKKQLTELERQRESLTTQAS